MEIPQDYARDAARRIARFQGRPDRDFSSVAALAALCADPAAVPDLCAWVDETEQRHVLAVAGGRLIHVKGDGETATGTAVRLGEVRSVTALEIAQSPMDFHVFSIRRWRVELADGTVLEPVVRADYDDGIEEAHELMRRLLG